jgi:LPS export ABC transporter protein LptC
VTLCLGRHCGPGAGLAVALLVLITACDRTAKLREAPSPPFVFRRLDLRQQDAAGRPTWELTSPEARYDIRRGLAQALQPRGIVYAKGEPIYRLEASSGVVLNDGEVIQLEGRIRVTRMGQEPLLIEASQVRWLPAQKLLEIDRHPQAFDSQTRLSARRARFLLDRNLLELRGAPLVQRWQQRFDPLLHLPRTRPEFWLQVAQLDWQPLSGDLTGRGPVRGERLPPDAKSGTPVQTLRAGALAGNSQRQVFNLSGPVVLDDPGQAAHLQADSLAIDLARQQLSSPTPFTARRQGLRIQGQAFRLDWAQHLVSIPAGCELHQPGEWLLAGSCRWNWQTQAIQADGGVWLQRRTNALQTRATSLSGRLGEGGEITALAPGGRVVTQFVVSRKPGPRPAADRR